MGGTRLDVGSLIALYTLLSLLPLRTLKPPFSAYDQFKRLSRPEKTLTWFVFLDQR